MFAGLDFEQIALALAAVLPAVIAFGLIWWMARGDTTRMLLGLLVAGSPAMPAFVIWRRVVMAAPLGSQAVIACGALAMLTLVPCGILLRAGYHKRDLRALAGAAGYLVYALILLTFALSADVQWLIMQVPLLGLILAIVVCMPAGLRQERG